MNEILQLLLAFLEGALLGVFFFVGLLWTVRRLSSSKMLGLLFLGSLLLRTAIVMLGFYYILDDDWLHLVAGLIGFVNARSMITRFTRSVDQIKTIDKAEG